MSQPPNDSAVRLILAIHNHQPVGNFDGVIEDAFNDSYSPFLDILEEYPEIRIALHTSGSLMEWLVERHPEYIARLRDFVARGQIEILGGPFFEPILACIPSRDRIGQMKAYTRYLEELLGCKVHGMWVPERVWEPSFAGDVTAAGIDFTILDDFHFKCAGFTDEQLRGYYLTEDQGRLLKIFPVSEKLRYTIPFDTPEATFEYLEKVHAESPGCVMTFGDDGEKFGVWPGTKELIYEKGWLRKFFELLRANKDWVHLTLPTEVTRTTPPVGRCYLPDASYREMTEWAMTTERQIEYKKLTKDFKEHDDFPRLQKFLRGVSWRNFLVRYQETHEMFCRAKEVSTKLHELQQEEAFSPEKLEPALLDLYRGQCNCPYWHGAFGGLYLPHLRNAIYRHLIAADSHIESMQHASKYWQSVAVGDFNLDARQEIRLANQSLIAYFSPAVGGHLYELDIRAIRHNLLATLNRRPEPYHEKIIEHASKLDEQQGGFVAEPHERVHFKHPDLDKAIEYDTWPRKALVDHMLWNDSTLEQFRKGESQLNEMPLGVYQTKLREVPGRIDIVMTREVPQYDADMATLTKTITLRDENPSQLDVHYEWHNLVPGRVYHVGVENNLAGMPAGAADRYFYDENGQRLGQLQTQLDLKHCSRISAVDEWLGIDVGIEMEPPAFLWSYPLYTVSQSEGGFELVHQSTAIISHWQFTADETRIKRFTLKIAIDTSAAQARQLAEQRSVVGV